MLSKNEFKQWWPEWEGSLGEIGYTCVYGWVLSLFTQNSHNIINRLYPNMGLSGSSNAKESAYNAGNLGSISGLGRYPGERNCNPLQYSCPEIPMNRGTWEATVHGVAKSQTRLSD